MTDDPRARLKRQAAEAAAALVQDGMCVGLGTGSTAYFAIASLIARVKDGLNITAIPTSERSAAQARDGGIRLVELTQPSAIDLTIDGADAVQRGSLDLVKGLGGALLREKMVATASKRLIIVVDDSKLADQLGLSSPVPVEVVQFGWQATAARIAALNAHVDLRQAAGNGGPFRTDGGNYILDCHMGAIDNVGDLDMRLRRIVGVVETGLFVGMANDVFVAGADGVTHLCR